MYTHASHRHHSLRIASFFQAFQAYKCTFPNLSLFVLISVTFLSPHLLSLSLNPFVFDFLSVFLLLSSLCFSLLGSILTPLNAKALINQCRVALFHRDPKQLVSSSVCLFVAAARPSVSAHGTPICMQCPLRNCASLINRL